MSESRKAPLVAYLILCLAAPARLRRDLLGDLAEEMERLREEMGERRARRWYWVQTGSSVLPLLERRLRRPRGRRRLDSRRRRELMSLMDATVTDLRYAWRQLRRRPGFAVMTVGVLSLAIGANTALFSLANGILLRPLPHVEAPGELVSLYTTDREGSRDPAISYPDFEDFRDSSRSFSALAAHIGVPLVLEAGAESARLRGAVVSWNYFEALGIEPLRGRFFLPEEDRTPLTHPVAVVSHRFWQQRLGAAPGVVGSDVVLNGTPLTVVGVAPAGFQGIERLENHEVWVPMMMQPVARPGSDPALSNREHRWAQAFGRLRPGTTVTEARAEIEALAASLAESYPESNGGWGTTLLPGIGLEERDRRQATLLAVVLTVPVVLLLTIACANVAGLLLARMAGRRREVGMRRALGASRGRLMRQLLTESLLLAALAVIGGLGVAALADDLILALLPVGVGNLQEAIAIDVRVVAFAVAVAAVTAALFGLGPALSISRQDLLHSLGGAVDGPASGRLRNVLAVLQVGVSVALLLLAGLFLETLRKMQEVEPGYRTEQTLVAGFDLVRQGYDTTGAESFFRRLLPAVEALPGVEAAGLAFNVPLSGAADSMQFLVDGVEPPSGRGGHSIDFTAVSPGYFETLGIPLLNGRDFELRDDAASLPVVVVNQELVRRFWPDENPIGKRLVDRGDPERSFTVVGVAADLRYYSLAETPRPYVYFPLSQFYLGGVALLVRADGDPETVLAGLRRKVRELDRHLAFHDATTLAAVLERSLWRPRVQAVLLAVCGLVSLLLAALGVYGLLAFLVAQRQREIGIRLALGARGETVLALFVGRGLRLALLGLVLGHGIGLALGRVLDSQLYGVSAGDPQVLAAVSAVLLVTALLATAIPARRAARVDPVATLRQE